VKVTAIALYGLMDEPSDASVHRSLSELSPIFDHEDYGRLLLLGGDLNVLAGRPQRAHLDRHQVVLERIRAYGLIDCLEATRPHGVLDDCPCGRSHTWTYRSRRRGRSHIPYQDDYLFASPALARGGQLVDCKALPFTEASDHAPVVASFEL
jgi:exonuclease III